MQRAPCPCPCPAVGGLFLGSTSCRPPPVAAGRLIFEGSGSGSGSGSAAAARTRSSHDDSTAPMTIIYAGSVRAYGGVTLEQAEKILAMVAKEARAAGILAEPHQLELVAAPTPTATGDDDAALMTMHYWRLAHHHVNDSLKRTASLARFLDKRKKQRAEISSAAATTTTMLHHHHPRRDDDRDQEWFFPAAQIMDDATVSARTSASLGGMDRRPGASQDHPKRMKTSHGEEDQATVSTELRI
ncbi:hypothetical protein SORBI_3004G042501 [Sorghum bicolor]|uniref:Protein TIFY n=1 Tax=Sorghum bicolor TaxID=4558 RepID=A0A1Z5RKV8_SORBI|nr:hypothetical protein SORBI_3004G042501 [Sorghum bicolor]